MGYINGPRLVTSGLILYVDATNEKSYTSGSTAWNDLSGINPGGTLLNGPTFDPANGGSVGFDGINDYMRVANFTGIDVQGPGTVIYWGKFGVHGNSLTLRGLGSRAIQLGSSASNEGVVWRFGGTPLLRYTAPTMNRLTNWSLTFDSSSLQMYINGILDSSTTSALPQSGSVLNFYMATYDTVPSAPWSGSIYSVAVYNRVLSETEIRQNYELLRGRYGL